MQNSRIVAAQEVDERKGALDARKADRNAAEANLQSLTQTQSFQKITAPFAGTVTKRFVEVGQLVTGNLNDSTRILFRIEHTAALRAFINVPQSYYRNISTGQTVALSFREVPGRTFPGTVVRTAGALDSATRTLRTEIQVPNEAGELIPGLYAEVKFQVQREHPPVTVPARAVIIQSAGPQIATVNGETSLLEALAAAGGFSKQADVEQAVVVREQKVLPVSLADIVKRGDMSQNLVLRHRDLIFVPSLKEQRVYVFGEVGGANGGSGGAGVFPIAEEGMTLVEAVARAGGLKADTADVNQIRVFRGGWCNPEVFTISACELYTYGGSIRLFPGDRVFVAPMQEASYARALALVAPLLTTPLALATTFIAIDAATK